MPSLFDGNYVDGVRVDDPASLLDGSEITLHSHAGSSGGAVFADVTDSAYGATGDGTTDDTAFIDLAINNAAGRDLYFPPGTYLVTGLAMDIDGQHWYLAAGATVQLDAAADADIVLVTASRWGIHGGVFDGDGANQTAEANGIKWDGSAANRTDGIIDGVRIFDAADKGIMFLGAVGGATGLKRGTIVNCEIDASGPRDIAGHGIMINHFVVDCVVRGNYIHDTGTKANGIWNGNDSENNVIDGNILIDLGDMGIEIWEVHNPCIVVNNVVDTTGLDDDGGGTAFGISIHDSKNTLVRGNSVRNAADNGIEIVINTSSGHNVSLNLIDDSGVNGIIINATTDGTFIGNVIRDALGAGYRITNGSPDRHSIEGGLIENAGTDGVELNAASDGTKIQGVRIVAAGDNGIDTAASNKVTVQNCIFTNCVGTSISIQGSDLIVQGNQISVTAANTERGIVVFNGTGALIQGNRVEGYDGAGGDGIEVTSSFDIVQISGNDCRGNTNFITVGATNADVFGNIAYIGEGEVRTVFGDLAAGVENAFAFTVQNPFSNLCLILNVIVRITTAGGTANSVINVDAVANATTSGDDILDGIDADATAIYDSMNATDAGTNGELRAHLWAQNGGNDDWVTGKILVEDAASLAGTFKILVIGL